ncbi:MAG: FIST N-terminal domain-containing protein [Arcobacteraceae bacterium]
MKTFTHEYSSKELLETFIKNNYITNYTSDLLVQIFTSVNNKEYILYLKDEVLAFLPNAKIIGTTTNGEISINGSLTHSTVISISVFEKTKIKTALVSTRTDSFDNGKEIIKKFEQKDDLKLLITFTDGLNTNGEEYLNGIASINNKVIVAGGMAGDYSKFDETLVFNENEITNNGAVAAAFYSHSLNIHTEYSFNWETVGQKHIVDKADKNRVYKISGKTTVDFYKHYLGEDIDKLLPAIGIEFPLVQKIDGVNTARAVLTKHDDGSLSFAGNIAEGSEVQFGHGDVQLIIQKGLDNIKNIIKSPIESIFIYSCMARKALLKDDINLEILPLREIAPISGFFAYGEFFNKSTKANEHPQLLNQSMTILAISENSKKIEKITPNIFSSNDSDDLGLHRTQALSTLIKRTTKELEDLNDNLHLRVKKEITLNEEKDNMLTLLHTQAQLGSILEMILHQWRQPISAITSTLSSVQVYKEAGILTDAILDENVESVLAYTEHLNTTIEDFRDLFKASDKNTNIAIDELITKSLTIINPIVKENQIKVTVDINIDNVIYVPVSLMMQVILNIVKNAIDVLKLNNVVNPAISIQAFQSTNNSIIKIIDNGGGIPANILPKIFEKNFTTKQGQDGTGIGLHMSKKIIETKVFGTLEAKNIEDGKVEFTITIPH